MKIRFLIHSVLTATALTSCAHTTVRAPAAATGNLFTEQVSYTPLGLHLRAGYAMEQGSLKGCVLFLEGLADSVLNHKPTFNFLNESGYRLIYFDYLGQGGSEGSMNDTRIQVELPPNATRFMRDRYQRKEKFYEIPEQADFIWSKYAPVQNKFGQDCRGAKKLVIGWSTGGLAAYRMAHEKRADAVVLIAPGINPKMMVGESAHHWDKMLMLKQTITESTLTRNKFAGGENPHVDPIRPTSPMHAPQFSMNLFGISIHSRHWNIDPSVAGTVFLSGAEDSYVDRDATIETLGKNAPHFSVKSYDGALHELDNELPEVAEDLRRETVRFFEGRN